MTGDRATARPLRDVVFDLGGVLIDWDPAYLFRDHLGGDPSEVAAFLREVCSPAWHASLDAGADFSTAAAALAKRFPRHADWIAEYGPGWERMFAGAHPQAVQCVQVLARRGYRLHALSNYPRQNIAFLYQAFPFMRVFHTVILSGLVGATKPDSAIYRYLAARLDGSPCLFVDDRPDNVAAARACGIDAMVYTPADGFGAVFRRLQEPEPAEHA